MHATVENFAQRVGMPQDALAVSRFVGHAVRVPAGLEQDEASAAEKGEEKK